MSTLRQRLAAPAGISGGGMPSVSSDPVRKLRKLDMYRKVPKDLTEGTAVGGLITTLSVIVLLLLTLAELRSLAQIKQETAIIVDRSEDGAFRINLNVTVLGLSCEFLSVDLKNALGTVRSDLSDETLHKYATDQKGSWMGSATKKSPSGVVHTYEIPQDAKDRYGNQMHAIELNANNFEEVLADYEVLLVDFHSPRCIHCVKFAPIYEYAAKLVKERSPGRGTKLDTHRKYGVALATVDCMQNIDLCRRRHIQAFPTVHVYRQHVQKGPKNLPDGRYFEPDAEHLYEVYHGPRDAEAISSFALRVLDELLSSDPTLGKNAFEAGPRTDVEGDGRSESTVHAAGCRVEGYLDVRRVPGSVIIRPHSVDDAHEFDTGLVNVDHTINHLSFGLKSVSETPMDAGPYSSPDSNVLPVVAKADINGFRALVPGSVHTHYIKVVSRTVVPLNQKPIQTYEYSIASDSFMSEDKVPFIEFKFDLSPLQIRVTETRKNWIEGITAMLALIGGVFSSSFLIEGLLSSFTTWMVDPKRA